MGVSRSGPLYSNFEVARTETIGVGYNVGEEILTDL
jgi:hypothetical protein